MSEGALTPGEPAPAVAAGQSGALELAGLTVSRSGRPVVRNVSIEIPAGEVTALLGPNGAGESSLVLAVRGGLRARSGAAPPVGPGLARPRPGRVPPFRGAGRARGARERSQP